MATTTRTRITVDEFVAMSEDDQRRMELVDGEVVVCEPGFPHASLQATLIAELEMWRRRASGHVSIAGPTEVRLTRHDLYGPDLVVCRANPSLDDRHTLAELPLICVEVRSPTTWKNDVGRKKAVYEAQGVPELWLVDDVARVILVYRRSAPEVDYFDTALELDASDTLTSPLLPGFALALSELFES